MRNIIVVMKPYDSSLVYLNRELVEWILTNYPDKTVYVQESLKSSKQFDAESVCHDSQCDNTKVKYWNNEFVQKHAGFFDLVITLGGDGTVLYVSSLFQAVVPPVLSFSLGSLGFLTTFQFGQFSKDLRTVFDNKMPINNRMRLECQVFDTNSSTSPVYTRTILNEVTIDRGPSPYITRLELYGDDSLFTVAQADGLIIATPTGSTAYSLSAGGSLVDPALEALLVTPICPNSLSFRPIILSTKMVLKVKIPDESRGTAWAAFDGKYKIELKRGGYIRICASSYAFPSFQSSQTEYIDSIRRTLNWNLREDQKSFTHMLSAKNQARYRRDSLCAATIQE